MQLIEQPLGLFQIERVKTFIEPAVDRSEKFARLLDLALIAPAPRHTHRRTQIPGFGSLLAEMAPFGFSSTWTVLPHLCRCL